MGWGATFSPMSSGVPRLARGFFDREFLHINIREMQAVERALLSFFPPCCRRSDSRRLRLMVDNQVVLYCIKAMMSHSPTLMAPLHRLQAACTARCILLDPEYIPSKENVLPDKLSRVRTGEDYKLNPSLYARLERAFGTRSLDRFASATRGASSPTWWHSWRSGRGWKQWYWHRTGRAPSGTHGCGVSRRRTSSSSGRPTCSFRGTRAFRPGCPLRSGI